MKKVLHKFGIFEEKDLWLIFSEKDLKELFTNPPALDPYPHCYNKLHVWARDNDSFPNDGDKCLCKNTNYDHSKN